MYFSHFIFCHLIACTFTIYTLKISAMRNIPRKVGKNYVEHSKELLRSIAPENNQNKEVTTQKTKQRKKKIFYNVKRGNENGA